jgi:hypothetical protein
MPYRLVTQDTEPHGFPEEYPTEEDWQSEGKDVRLWMNEHGILLAQVNLLLKQGRDWVALIDTARTTQRKAHRSSLMTTGGGSETTGQGQTRWGALMELRRLASFAGVYYSKSVLDAIGASQKTSENFLAQAIDDQGTTWGEIIVRAVPINRFVSLGFTDDNVDPTNYSVIKVRYLCTSNPPCPTPEEMKNRILNATNLYGTSVAMGMRAFNLSLVVEVATGPIVVHLQTLNKKP